MFEKFKKLDIYLLCLIGITILACFLFAGHYNEMLTDLGREVYYPEQILKGKVLYKDLFNIYGPMSYMLNALWYKIFGIKLETLYFSGSVLALFFVCGIYESAKLFLDKISAFILGIFTIVLGVMSPVIFNFVFPYSQAMLYGSVFFTWSAYFLARYYSKPQNTKFLIISSLFAGFAIANKYEFLLYGMFICILIFVDYIKRKNIKNLLYGLLTFLIPILLPIIILFIQGLRLNDLLKSFHIVNTMTHTQTLKTFYSGVGIVPTHMLFKILALKTFLTAVIFGMIYIVLKIWDRNKFLSASLGILFILLITLFTNISVHEFIMFLPILTLILLVINYKKLLLAEKVFVFSSLIASAKVFFSMLLYSYGSFCAPGIITSFFILNKDKKYLLKTSQLLLIILTLLCFSYSIKLQKTFSPVDSGRGTFYTKFENAKVYKELINFIDIETKDSDNILIVPEGMTINFMTKRNGYDFYNSFIPLYIETFGEEVITDYYKINNPEYIVIFNPNNREYGFSSICEDFALSFCSFVNKKYNYDTEILGKEITVRIYKKK